MCIRDRYDLFNNTKKAIGAHKMMTYNIQSANCQHLVVSMLRSSGLLNKEANDFIKQDTDDLVVENIRKGTNTVTDIARTLRPVAELFSAGYTNPMDAYPFRPQGYNPIGNPNL